jgi:hypothetical protein
MVQPSSMMAKVMNRANNTEIVGLKKNGSADIF